MGRQLYIYKTKHCCRARSVKNPIITIAGGRMDIMANRKRLSTNKKKLLTICIVLLTMLSNIVVYANDEVQKYDLERLRQIYTSKSLEIDTIDLETKLLQTQYNDKIKDYKDFKKVVDDLEDNMNAAKAIREHSIEVAKRARDATSIEAAAQSAQFALMQYIMLRNQYRLRVRESVQMSQVLEPIIFQISQAEARKQNSLAKAEYGFEKDYYSLVSLHKELDLLDKDVENMTKKLKIDVLREELGMITVLEREETEKQMRELKINKEKLRNGLELLTEKFRTKLNMDMVENVDIEYETPKSTNLKNYRPKNVVSQLKENNLDLAAVKHNTMLTENIFNKLTLAYDRMEEYNETQISLKQYESERDQIKVAEIEFEKSKIQQYNLEKNLELYANDTYYEYKKAQETLISNTLYNNDLYDKKTNSIELNYVHGLISKLEYEFQKQQLNRELNKLEQDKINYINAKNKIELALKGIIDMDSMVM